jgi:hypothetical protein
MIPDCLEYEFTSHDLCDKKYERKMVTRGQALLTSVDDIPLGKIRPCDTHKLENSSKLRMVCGLDNIPNECLKHLPRRLLVHLTHLFDHCIWLAQFSKPR